MAIPLPIGNDAAKGILDNSTVAARIESGVCGFEDSRDVGMLRGIRKVSALYDLGWRSLYLEVSVFLGDAVRKRWEVEEQVMVVLRQSTNLRRLCHGMT